MAFSTDSHHWTHCAYRIKTHAWIVAASLSIILCYLYNYRAHLVAPTRTFWRTRTQTRNIIDVCSYEKLLVEEDESGLKITKPRLRKMIHSKKQKRDFMHCVKANGGNTVVPFHWLANAAWSVSESCCKYICVGVQSHVGDASRDTCREEKARRKKPQSCVHSFTFGALQCIESIGQF